jgi:hypothetical protein
MRLKDAIAALTKTICRDITAPERSVRSVTRFDDASHFRVWPAAERRPGLDACVVLADLLTATTVSNNLEGSSNHWANGLPSRIEQVSPLISYR